MRVCPSHRRPYPHGPQTHLPHHPAHLRLVLHLPTPILASRHPLRLARRRQICRLRPLQMYNAPTCRT